MKTITLKTDDTFFEHVTQLAKNLHLTKSELIRRSIKAYENHIKKEQLKEQIKQAALNVRQSNASISQEFSITDNDGLENV
ncbi:DNA-binding protein [Sulfurimonas sediminis]|uniref:DNA-binding protein n=1 Tax=Sulfurimonas sediminis TaxID=2590020 RepID=A0A7M1AYN0_9BACT|nr:DNA-binding protein [Sulfurimonas sediminis]QOP42597.1 DNA-binding protein [Sulfurimonas sediminis]